MNDLIIMSIKGGRYIEAENQCNQLVLNEPNTENYFLLGSIKSNLLFGKGRDFSEIIHYLTEYEIEIILKLLSYPYIVKLASNAREPHRLTNFIEDVSASFHSLWNKGKENESLRFIDEKDLIKTQTKLIWLQSMRIVFENVFNIIGIEYHETM